MEIKDVLEKPLVVMPKDILSHVASRMLTERRHEAVVMDGDRFLGVVLARDLVRKKVSDPHRTNISGFVTEMNPFLPGASLEEIVNGFLVNDYRTIPMKMGDQIMLLTKINLLKFVRGNPAFKGKCAEDVMKSPYCIGIDDSLSTARAVLKEMDISRVPVVKDGKVEGMIDTLDLLSPIVKGEVTKRGEPDEERTHLDNVPASSFMRKNFPKAEPSMPLSDVIDLIVKNQSAVIVERDESLVGLVTPGDVLKFLGKEVKGAYVTVSGLREEDDFIKSVIYEEIENSLRKINKFYPVNYLVAHMDKYHTTGKKPKYSFKVRLATERGFFFAHDYSWDITKAMRGVLAKLEKEIIKKKERLEC